MPKDSDFMKDFVRVGRGLPCHLCNKQSWCLIHRSGTWGICQRVPTDTTYGDAGWRYSIPEKIDVSAHADAPSRVCPAEIEQEWKSTHVHAFDSVWARAPESYHALQYEMERLEIKGVFRRPQQVTFPMRDARGRLCGVQFRDLPSGRKWCLQGSRLGLFLPHDWQSMDWQTTYICEGPTDTAAVLSLGCSAVGRPSSGTGSHLISKWLTNLTEPPERIVIVADPDPPGQLGAMMLAKVINPDIIATPLSHKDARECIMKGGGPELAAAKQSQITKNWKIVEWVHQS